jgi:hypothetical protein
MITDASPRAGALQVSEKIRETSSSGFERRGLETYAVNSPADPEKALCCAADIDNFS